MPIRHRCPDRSPATRPSWSGWAVLASGLASWHSPDAVARRRGRAKAVAAAPGQARDRPLRRTGEHAAAAEHADDRPDSDAPPPRPAATDVWTEGSVTAGGAPIDVLRGGGHAGGASERLGRRGAAAGPAGKGDADDSQKNPPAAASMFYVAYLKRNVEASARPITFLVQWRTRIGDGVAAYGGVRTEAGRYRQCDALRTGAVSSGEQRRRACSTRAIWCSSTRRAPDSAGSPARTRIKRFTASIEDAHAFAEFITAFLSKYQRWNSPKYLFGESYGTTRAAVLVNLLQNNPGVDFNGVIMLSQVLSANLYPDQPKYHAGQRSALSTGAADLRGDGVVSSSAAGRSDPPTCRLTLLRRCRTFRDGRLRRRSGGRCESGSGRARRHRREAARIHRPVGGLSAPRRPAGQRRRIPPGVAARPRPHRRRRPIRGSRDTRWIA